MSESNVEALLLKHTELTHNICILLTEVNEVTAKLVAAIEQEEAGYPENKEVLEQIAKSLADQNERMRESVTGLMTFMLEDLDG